MARPIRNVTQFLDRGYSVNTINSYKTAIKQFFSTIKDDDLQIEDLDEKSEAFILKLRQEEYPDIASADYIRAYNNTIGHLTPKSRSQKIQAVLSFLKSNHIAANNEELKNVKPKGGGKAVTRNIVPDSNLIMRLCENLDSHARVLTMVLATSGLRLNEGRQLKIDDIELNHSPVKIHVRHTVAKNKKARYSLITTETEKRLEEWLSRREDFIKKNIKFVVRDNPEAQEKARVAYWEKNKDVVFPWTLKNWHKMWNKALEKIGEDQKDPVTGRRLFTAHKLRSFFKAAFVNPEVAEYLSGRELGVAGIYSNFDQNPKKVIEEYRKAESKLAIYEYVDTQRVQLLQEKIEAINKGNVIASDNLNHYLATERKRNTDLSKEVDALRTQVNNLQGEIQYIVKWMDQEINSRAVLKSGGGVETIHATKEEALADLQEKKSAKNR